MTTQRYRFSWPKRQLHVVVNSFAFATIVSFSPMTVYGQSSDAQSFCEDVLKYFAPDEMTVWVGEGRTKGILIVDTIRIERTNDTLQYVSIIADKSGEFDWRQESHGTLTRADSGYTLTCKTGYWPTITMAGLLVFDDLLFQFTLGPMTLNASVTPRIADVCDVRIWVGNEKPKNDEYFAKVRLWRLDKN